MIDPLFGNSAAHTQALSGSLPGAAAQTSVLSNVASLLGMGADDLTTALRNGASMSDLASQRGISRDDLLAAIDQGLQSSPNAASGDTTTLATRIADRRGIGGHRLDHPRGGGGSGSTLEQNIADLATSVGISSDQLLQALQTGLTGTGASGYGVSSSLLQGLRIDQLA